MQINKGDKIQVFGYDTTFVVIHTEGGQLKDLIRCYPVDNPYTEYNFPPYKVEKVLAQRSRRD